MTCSVKPGKMMGFPVIDSELFSTNQTALLDLSKTSVRPPVMGTINSGVVIPTTKPGVGSSLAAFKTCTRPPNAGPKNSLLMKTRCLAPLGGPVGLEVDFEEPPQ